MKKKVFRERNNQIEELKEKVEKVVLNKIIAETLEETKPKKTTKKKVEK